MFFLKISFNKEILNKSLVIGSGKNEFFDFLRGHTEGGTNVYHRLVPVLRQNWEGRQPISCKSCLKFHIFAFWGWEDHFWDSLHKSFRELPGSQFGPTFDITTDLYDNSIFNLNTALERILSVLLSRNKSFLLSFTSIGVICPQLLPKCCFYLKIPISSNGTFTAKIRKKNVFPEIDTIFFWRPKTL